MMRLWLLTLALLLGLASGAQADPMEDLRAGNTAFKEGRYEEAVQAYTKSIISGQLGAEALAVTFNNRGVAYGELGDFDRAILDYNEALALKQDDATAIRNLRVGLVRRGVAQANMGEAERALADYDKAIELDPSHFLAYLRRGQLRLERGEMQAAIQDLEQVEALDPYNQQAKELLAQARTQLAQGDRQAPAATAAEPAPASAAATPPVVASAEEPPAGPAVPAPAAAPEPSITVTAAPSPSPSPAASARPQRPEPARQQQAAVPAAAAPAAGGVRRVRVKQAVNFRAGPGNDFERLTTVPGGAELPVLGVTQGWYELQLGDGRRGYIYQSWLDPIDR